MEEIFEIRSCIEMLVKDIKIYTIDQYICSIVNKELQGIYTGTGRVGSQYNHTIPYLKQSHSQLENQMCHFTNSNTRK